MLPYLLEIGTLVEKLLKSAIGNTAIMYACILTELHNEPQSKRASQISNWPHNIVRNLRSRAEVRLLAKARHFFRNQCHLLLIVWAVGFFQNQKDPFLSFLSMSTV